VLAGAWLLLPGLSGEVFYPHSSSGPHHLQEKKLTSPLLAVSADVLARLNLYEQYAAAAYCPGNNNSPNTKVTCSTGNCPLVQAANTNTVSEFQKYVSSSALLKISVLRNLHYSSFCANQIYGFVEVTIYHPNEVDLSMY